MNSVWNNRPQIISLFVLIILTTAIFYPMNAVMVSTHGHNDFHAHIRFATDLSLGQPMPEFIKAHPVWQLSVLALNHIFRISLENGAIVVQMFFQLFLAVVLFWLFRNSVTPKKNYLLVILPLAMMVVSQIMLLVFWDRLYYLGYVGMTTYHNPTIIMLKPFALMLIVYNIDLIHGERFHWMKTLLSAFIVIISSLVKPNLIICLLPATGIFILFRLISRKKFDWIYLVFGLTLPAVIVLAWQFFVTYGMENASIFIAPLAVMKNFSNFLLLKLILSIWFPGFILIAYFKQLTNDRSMPFNWLIFFFGAIFTYFFAEGGDRFPHANFGWSGEIALFTLFVFSVLFFFKQKETSPIAKWKTILCAGLIPHIIAGVIYYFYTLTQNTFI